MKRYATLKTWLREILDEEEHQDVAIYPGPEVPNQPGKYVVCTPYGGPGEDLEGVLDQRSWQIRCIGSQMGWEDVEEIANLIDEAFLQHYTGDVGNERVVSIQRVGGSPAPLNIDDAERVHFVCSYIFGVGLGLANH